MFDEQDADADDTEDTEDTGETGADSAPAIPTAEEAAALDDDDGSNAGPADPQQTGAPQGVLGAAQSAGSDISELLALIRAVNQYGLRMAGQQKDQSRMPQGQPQQQGVRSFEEGGAIPTADDDGDDDKDQDVTGSVPAAQPKPAPGYAQEGPFDPQEEALNTREKALDQSGLGGAFGAAQHQKINAARQEHAQVGPSREDINPPDPAQSKFLGQKPPHQVLAEGTLGQATAGLMNYLKGEKAVDGNTAAAIGYAIDPNGALPPVQKKMQMIQYAYQKGLTEGGDPRTAMDLALGVLQHQRKEYDMWRTAAAVKMDHGDVGTAIDAANKAFQAPFGENVHFAASDGGLITATVTGNKGEVQGTFPMQQAQFRELMLKHGQFDALIQNGLFDTLAGLSASEQPAPGATPAPQTSQGGAPSRPNPVYQTGPKSPEEQDRERFPILQAPEGVDQKLFDQSRRIFPWASQNSQREAWIAQQQQQQGVLAGKENVAKIVSQGRTDRVKEAQTNINQRQEKTIADRDVRQERSIADRDQRQDKAIAARREMFDKGWQNRVQAAAVKAAGANRSDPTAVRKTAIVRDGLSRYGDDVEGFKKYLTERGVDYDRDILGTGTPQVQPQQTPAAPSQGTPGKGAAKGGSKPPPKVGEVRDGFRFLGGSPADKNAWERAGE